MFIPHPDLFLTFFMINGIFKYKQKNYEGNDMRVNRKLILILIVFILSSCAGLFLSGAEREFEEGLALFNRGLYEEAIVHFNKSTELDPMFPKPYLYLGRSYLNLGRWAEAVQPLRTAFRLAPAETKGEVVNLLFDALFGAAVSDFKKGDFKNSIGFLKEALQYEPSSGKAVNELVMVLIAQGGNLLSEGKTREAIDSFSEAIRMSPDNSEAYIGLARSFVESGDILKALSALEKALKIDPTNRDAKSLFNKLLK